MLMDDTEYSITWRGRRIPYSIRRHGKRIFPGVIVLPGGKVEVLAPPDFAHASAGELVTEEAPWIVQRLAGVVCRYAAAPHEFVTGESIAYLGRSYRLKVLPGESGRMKLRHRCLEVSVETETRQAVRAALASWFRGKAEERFPQQVEAWHEVVGGPTPTVVISNQRKRLASCERDGTIRLNWRLIQVPDWMTDYVAVRQLVRLWHPGPGRDFWQAFERVMPDCRFRREALRREEPGRLPKPGAFQPALDLDGYPAPHPDDTRVHLEMAYELARAVIEQARVAEQAKERLTALDLERYQARLLRRGWGTCEEREERMLRDIGRLPRDEAEIEPHRQEALEVQAVACGSWRAAVGKLQQYHGMIIPMCKVIATAVAALTETGAVISRRPAPAVPGTVCCPDALSWYPRGDAKSNTPFTLRPSDTLQKRVARLRDRREPWLTNQHLPRRPRNSSRRWPRWQRTRSPTTSS